MASEGSVGSIHEAVALGDRRAVAAHLQRQPECVLHRDDEQRTPLLLAAAAGDCTTVTVLIRRMGHHDAGAINWPDLSGLTPLHWACTQQRYEVVELLLRHGASTEAEDEDGRRPIHSVAFAGNVRCMSLLLRHVSHDGVSAPSSDGLTPLHYSALSGSCTAISLLLEARANLHAKDEERRTALSWAASEAHDQAVEQLLAANADPCATDANGLGPLHHAVKSGAIACVQHLLNAGASALSRSVGGMLPEELARCHDSPTAAGLVALLALRAEAEAYSRQEALISEEAAEAEASDCLVSTE